MDTDTWADEQQELKKRLDLTDTYDTPLTHVGGVDISFIKDDNVNACASLYVLTFPALKVVYKRCKMVQLTAPYVSGFLAFREVPALKPLIDELRVVHPELVPQVLLVDGNGTLHPRGFGLACHLGVECNLPTIGVAKTLLSCNGIPHEKEVRRRVTETLPPKKGERLELRDKENILCGYAVRPTDQGERPIYVSGGHRVSMTTAVDLVLQCCQVKIPEPIRQADLGSRDELRRAGFNSV